MSHKIRLQRIMMQLNFEKFPHLCAPNSVETNFNFWQNPMMLHILPPNFYHTQIFPRFSRITHLICTHFYCQKLFISTISLLVPIDATGVIQLSFEFRFIYSVVEHYCVRFVCYLCVNVSRVSIVMRIEYGHRTHQECSYCQFRNCKKSRETHVQHTYKVYDE